MIDKFLRTRIILGDDAMEKLKNSKVAIFGVGGVGGYVCEALVRSGVGQIDIIDKDEIDITNINRQIIATTLNVGKLKVDMWKERILEINPDCICNAFPIFYLPETKDLFDFSKYDYVIDCVDTIKAKIQLVMECNLKNTPIISSMGAGNKLIPNAFKVSDIYKTKVDPLARVMRQELKKRRIKKLKVVYSEEVPLKPLQIIKSKDSKKISPGSNAFVPASAGLLIASEVIKDLINK